MPNTVAAGEAIQLLAPKVGDGDGIINLRNSHQVAGYVAVHQSKRTQKGWFQAKTPEAFSKHKEWMVTADVIRPSILH